MFQLGYGMLGCVPNTYKQLYIFYAINPGVKFAPNLHDTATSASHIRVSIIIMHMLMYKIIVFMREAFTKYYLRFLNEKKVFAGLKHSSSQITAM